MRVHLARLAKMDRRGKRRKKLPWVISRTDVTFENLHLVVVGATLSVGRSTTATPRTFRPRPQPLPPPPSQYPNPNRNHLRHWCLVCLGRRGWELRLIRWSRTIGGSRGRWRREAWATSKSPPSPAWSCAGSRLGDFAPKASAAAIRSFRIVHRLNRRRTLVIG